MYSVGHHALVDRKWEAQATMNSLISIEAASPERAQASITGKLIRVVVMRGMKMVATTKPEPTKRMRRSDSVGLLPLFFVVSAVLLVGFWILWLSTYVLHRSYIAGDTTTTASGRLESWWPWLMVAGMGWGLLNLYWSIDALRRANLKSFRGHWLVTVACGLIVIGIEAVLVARALTIAPIVIDHSSTASQVVADTTATQPAAFVAGDPDKGKAVFSKTCITCHGPTGRGMPNLAPSLAGSQFIGGADDAAVAGVIRLGRALGEPNNKSGKVMPARGGNPFLTEEDISHLVAFVRAIQSAPAASADAGTPAVQLAAWVVPAATRPTAGIDLGTADEERFGGIGRIEYNAQQRSWLMRTLTILLTTVHGVFLAGVVAISSSVILPQVLYGEGSIDARFIKLSMLGWVLAGATWVLIAWLCFWWS